MKRFKPFLKDPSNGSRPLIIIGPLLFYLNDHDPSFQLFQITFDSEKINHVNNRNTQEQL
jgi:hypothetical protein